MYSWSIRTDPLPYLRLDATIHEGYSVMSSNPKTPTNGPGWFISLQSLMALPSAASHLRVLHAASLDFRKPTLVVFFATDMEQHGWVRPVVEGHELQHARLQVLSFPNGKPDPKNVVARMVAVSIPRLRPHIDPYLDSFPAGLAFDELFADLAGIEAGVSAGLSTKAAIAACCRNKKQLTELWETGTRASVFMDSLEQHMRSTKPNPRQRKSKRSYT